MPRLRRRGHLLRGKLTDAEELELTIGQFANRSAFKDEDSRRRAYFAHRDEVNALVSDGWTWARIEFDCGGFLPREGTRITAALARIQNQKGKNGPTNRD